MKQFYAVLLFFFISICQGQIVDIPNENLKWNLLNHAPVIDLNYDGEIQLSEAQAATTLKLSNNFVEDYTSLSAFSNVTWLEIYGSYLTGMDFSIFPMLSHLDCHDNDLTSLDLSALANLTWLDCSRNALTSLDVSANSQLLILNCSTNAIDNLDVSMLFSLSTLKAYQNGMTTLIANGLTHLESVECFENDLSSLDLTGAQDLNYLDCGYNLLTSLTIQNPASLSVLKCPHNQLNSFDAAPFTSLTLLSCPSNGLTSVNVLGLTNLQTLAIGGNNLGTVDLSTLSNLIYLNVYDAQLTSLDLSNLVNLQTLMCSVNPLGSLNFSNCTQLKDINCFSNQLTQLDVSALPLLESLSCGDNQLITLHLNNNPLLYSLNCWGNQLTSLDLSANPYIRSADCSANLFETLDFSYTTTALGGSSSFKFSDNPNLEFVNLKNGLYSPFVNIANLNCPNLAYVCASEQNLGTLQSQFSAVPNVMVGTYCSFAPGGLYNTIQGTVHVDLAQDGCSETDPVFADLKLTITDGTNNGAYFTNADGTYTFNTGAGSFTVAPVLENNYFTFSGDQTVVFPAADSSTQNRNFCLSPNGIHYDPEITITPIDAARPGFDATYLITYKNIGNQTMSGSVSFTYDDSVLDLVSADISPDSQSTGMLSWNYANLAPFESRDIYVKLNVNSPVEIPAVNNDDLLNFTASISVAAGDAETPENNVFQFPQTVVGSYDPNDKTCVEGSLISQQMVGDYLHYVIRFQNSGTFYAQNVVVRDVIDATKYDISTLRPIAASHTHETRITDNVVEFIFENIMLPAEQDDEPGSHGFVSFKIKTKPNLVIGNSVSNSADIFFDYNFPIVTEPAVTTVSNLGVSDHVDASVSIFPNPVKNKVTVTADSAITSLELYDVQGRLIGISIASGTEAQMDLSTQAQGVYFLKVKTDKGSSTQKIIRQ
ncbi:DUF7619 domain-containing protein [Flavobacterium silvaticum]|uniref:T9SS type A sorting domain-containing protein n=1 Tax=Flavobacterium silvaticum TaxID=1852020 RepID=A0A972FTH1_9FLAO|nr:T9SS type A sorting domain-containing protein [Flavobacterium silvaticum]NMH27260.1 T9SS type A sorting domain-containing protein [Flavobacterium silvaticum]